MSGLCTLAVINLLFLYIPSTQTSLPKSSTKSFHIIEKSPEGTVVVNDLRQLLDVISPSEGGGAGTGLLAITNGALPGASAFKIDQTRGSLVVASPPDRDTLCPTNSRGNLDVVSVAESSDHRDAYITVESSGSHYVSGSTSTSSPCVIPITIVYGSPSDPSFDSISIILDDVNDNAPQFDTSGEEHIIRVMETAHSPMETGPIFGGKLTPKRLRIPLPEAIDRDAPENGVRHYRLEGEDAYLFFLDVGRGDESGVSIETSGRHLISSSSDKRLWLVPSRMSGDAHFGLDHEQRKEYRFVLVAVDGGTPPRSGRLPIRLIVEDVNDHVPTFSQTQYSGVVSEDDLPGHVILQVQASDADGKYENHRINFRIPGKEGHSVGSIQYSEAQLAAANFFEIEPINTYDFNTEASGDHRRNVTTGQLIVQRISESQVRAAAKRAIEAAKKLQISNMELPSSRNRYRPPGVRSYILRFLIEAYDFGKPPLSSQVPVYVEIVDVNDEAPKIFVQYISPLTQLSQGRKNCGSLLEGQGRSMIAQVTVIDNDAASINSDVACMLNDTQFALESISTMGNTGWPSLGTGNPDSDVFQTTLMYKLMSNSPIDREGAAGSTVSVQITCTDNQDMDAASKRLTSHMEVCINIEDVNDNPPQFTAAAYTFKVAENVPSNRSRHFMRTKWGHFIGRVHANDRDAGKNARIAYSISQSANGIIDIDADNGSLFLISAFDREKTKHFEFTVVATDQAESNQTTFGRLSSTAEVRIIVTDVNDCQPEFESASYSFEVEENIELAEVGRVKATDADTGDYGRVRYSLSTENFASQSHAERRNSNALITSLFQIDPRLGVIRLRGHLDREKQVHYEFLVLAVDNMPLSGDTPSGHSSAAVRFTATATVLVMVLDQNDNPPQIISPRNLAEFMLSPDQVVAGTTVFTIEAIDSDQGENSTIEYELIATDVNSENVSDVSTSRVTKHFPFAIDQTAGVCYLKQNLLPLGSEGVNLYTFRIKAYDLGTPSSLNSTVTVRIVRGSKGLATTYTDSLLRNRYGAEGSAKIPAGGEGGYASPGDWYADWGGEISGIPNKTLVIIIVATFAVVILLGVLVLVYFRYQRSFNARMFVNGVLGNPPQSKGTEGYIAGPPPFAINSSSIMEGSSSPQNPRCHVYGSSLD